MISETRAEIREIDKEICALQAKRKELEALDILSFKQEAASNIGRCFKVDGNYVKVIDVPQERLILNSVDFNRYQYPALYIDGEDDTPFFIDTLFSAAWGEGKDNLHHYEEIAPQKFSAAFDKKMGEFCKNVGEDYTGKKYKRFYDYWVELYGKGLAISGWHLNGEEEPFDNFFESALRYMEEEND